jgi:hypothetical protein
MEIELHLRFPASEAKPYKSISTRAPLKAPQTAFGGAGVEISPSRAPTRFFHPARRKFSSGAPDPNPVHGGGGGRAGAPARRVARRVAHCQRHDRRFVVSTRPSPRLSR